VPRCRHALLRLIPSVWDGPGTVTTGQRDGPVEPDSPGHGRNCKAWCWPVFPCQGGATKNWHRLSGLCLGGCNA